MNACWPTNACGLIAATHGVLSTAFAEETEMARAEIQAAREFLPAVEIPKPIAEIAIDLIRRMNIDSLRAEITLLEAARAFAASDGRNAVELEDIRTVAPMALRLRRSAFMHQYFQDRQQEEQEMLASIQSLGLNQIRKEFHAWLSLQRSKSSFQNRKRIKVEKPADYAERGWLYFSHKKFDLAADDFNRVVGMDASDIEAWYGLGLTLKGEGAKDQAVDAFEHVMRSVGKYSRSPTLQRAGPAGERAHQPVKNRRLEP